MTKICIAIDAMGGDYGPKITVPAALQVLCENVDLNLILVGEKLKIKKELSIYKFVKHNSRLIIKNASQIIKMNETPSFALRNKKDSSMRVALNLIQSGLAQACVSSGNTGALMAISRFVLKMLPGINRPAIMFPFPSMKKSVYVLDLGANIECQAEHLFQFAVMGSISVKAIENISHPKVGLLNIGAESIKGTEQIKKTSKWLNSVKEINYIGYVEGNDIYKGEVDVVVCDGFAGNVALKTSEGLAKMLLYYTKNEFNKNLYNKLMGILTKPILKALFNKFNINHYNGGSLLGLQGVVLKSHGGATIDAFATAIRVAIKEVKKNIPKRIHQSISSNFKSCEFA